jgi:phosphoribosylaminoimidazole-succinocarboxamide synthase
VYIEAYETITGQHFVAPARSEPPLTRIRRNLAPYFSSAA